MPLKGPHEHLPFPSHTQGLWIHTLAGWHGMRVALKGWKGWRFSQVRIKIGLSWNVWRSVKPVIEKSISWPSGYQIKLALAERTKDLGHKNDKVWREPPMSILGLSQDFEANNQNPMLHQSPHIRMAIKWDLGPFYSAVLAPSIAMGPTKWVASQA